MIRTLWKKLFGEQELSKQVARSRLQLVLVQDRTGLSNEEMLSFKREMMGVVERYFVVHDEGFDISYRREGDSTTLLINSPVVVKRVTGPIKTAANGTPASQPNPVNNNYNKKKNRGQPNPQSPRP